jgi:hypothetical protein
MLGSTSKSLFGLCLSLLLISSAAAQNTASETKQFNLVVFGNNLDAESTQVWLKENPGIDNNWIKLESGQKISGSENTYSSIIYPGLSTEKFAGQDIRENYIAIKIRATDAQPQKIRAIYALPKNDGRPEEVKSKIHTAIKSHPNEIRKYSLASLLLPNPITIVNQEEVIEHVEMPVRHLKPGLQEVKWLDIIFQN